MRGYAHSSDQFSRALIIASLSDDVQIPEPETKSTFVASADYATQLGGQIQAKRERKAEQEAKIGELQKDNRNEPGRGQAQPGD